MRTIFVVLLASVLVVLSACGGSGGGGSQSNEDSLPAIALSVDRVQVKGRASWPGASAVEVKIDGQVVPVVEGVWSTEVSFDEAASKTFDLELIADGVIVETTEIVVSR